MTVEPLLTDLGDQVADLLYEWRNANSWARAWLEAAAPEVYRALIDLECVAARIDMDRLGL